MAKFTLWPPFPRKEAHSRRTSLSELSENLQPANTAFCRRSKHGQSQPSDDSVVRISISSLAHSSSTAHWSPFALLVERGKNRVF